MRYAEKLMKVVYSHPNEGVAAVCYASRNLSANTCDLSFELPQTRFVSVLKDNSLQCRTTDSQIAQRYSMRFHLLWNDMAACDFNLLFFRVTRKPDDLHTIFESRMDSVQHVGRRHEHHIR